MICTQCQIEFEHLPGEEEAYKKFSHELPERCSECRQRRRMAFRNEKHLYYNKSYSTGKSIIALYSEDSLFRVIDQDEWWEDSFDATEYAREYDFSKPFFEQFRELQKEVPRWSRIFINCENSDFTNNCDSTKNSYLAFSCHDCSDVYYCVRIMRSHDCIDCFNVIDSQYCSQSLELSGCYDVHYSQLANNCRDSFFMFDCKGCSDCILCSGVRNKKYMVLNKQYTKEDYEKYKKDFLEKLYKNKKEIENLFEKIKKQTPHKNLTQVNAENSMGDFINDSKDIVNGFNVSRAEDCINVYDCDGLKNGYDNYSNDHKSELCLECDTCHEVYNCKFCSYIGGSSSMQYCEQCFYSENCFGCIGIKKMKNMILNREYSAADYKIMLNKIRSHMKETGEYGKPFPTDLSSFAYNETVAHVYYPLEKEQAEKEGFTWYIDKSEAKHFGKNYAIPSDINDVDKEICDKVLICEETGKNYKIIPQELGFYKKFKLPVPKISPDRRYENLIKIQNLRRLRKIKCADCGETIETTYSKEDGLKIICEKCYLKTVY